MATFKAIPRRTYSFRPRSRHTWRRYRGLVILVATIFVVSWYFGLFARSQPYAQAATRKIAKPRGDSDEPRIGKASMLYGRRNELYERALDSHHRHNLMHGYSMDVLRRDMTQGYWNKLAWLLSLVVRELAKPENERLNWIMWVEAPNIILNPKVPLRAFLPLPYHQLDHVHFIGSRQDGDLNRGAFFLHVHPWTMELLVQAMSLPMLSQDTEQALGYDKDINALATVLNTTAFRYNVFYQPRTWYNTLHYSSPEESGTDEDDVDPNRQEGYEGEEGSLLVQFPAESNGAKWKHMDDWLKALRYSPNAFEMRYDRTHYPKEIEQYWRRLGEGREMLWEADLAMQGSAGESPGSAPQKRLYKAFHDLSQAVSFSAGDDDLMQATIRECKSAVDNVIDPINHGTGSGGSGGS